MLVYKPIEYKKLPLRVLCGIHSCLLHPTVHMISISQIFPPIPLAPPTTGACQQFQEVNINTSYSLHLSFSWGTSNFWFVGRMSSSNLFYESPREHTFTVISYYWVSESIVPYGMSISSHFTRLFHKKEFVQSAAQVFFLRRCDICNYLRTVICNAFRYFMTVCAHSVVRPEKLWPIRVCQMYVLLASSTRGCW